MADTNSIGKMLTIIGLLCIFLTALLGLFWAPTVTGSWTAPEAYRILYWHVPIAWVSILSYIFLFVGAISWYSKRKEWGWKLVVVGSELALIFGLAAIISGTIWASAEWGVPWDWSDLRLNTFALLTTVSLFLVLARESQPDGIDTRDTLSAIGLFGFVLVPITLIATTWYQNRHPGIIIPQNTEESGLSSEILELMMMGTVSFMILFIGLSIVSYSIISLESELQNEQIKFD